MKAILRSHFSGIILMAMASLAFSVNVVCVKYATQNLPVIQVVFFRSFFGILILAPYMRHKRVTFVGRHYALLLARGILGCLALCLHFLTLSKLNLGTAVILNYTGPIFTAILAMIYLKERPTPTLLSMTALAFLGVGLLMGTDKTGHLFYSLLALFSGLVVAYVTIVIRTIGHRESPLTIIFYFVGFSTLVTAPFALLQFQWPSLYEWLALVLIGVATFYAQIWLTVALRRSDASLVTPFSYLTPLFAFLFGFLLWNEAGSWLTILGAGLIITAGIVICVKEATD